MSNSLKGYWINHVVEIKDPERFRAYAEASKPMFKPKVATGRGAS